MIKSLHFQNKKNTNIKLSGGELVCSNCWLPLVVLLSLKLLIWYCWRDQEAQLAGKVDHFFFPEPWALGSQAVSSTQSLTRPYNKIKIFIFLYIIKIYLTTLLSIYWMSQILYIIIWEAYGFFKGHCSTWLNWRLSI